MLTAMSLALAAEVQAGEQLVPGVAVSDDATLEVSLVSGSLDLSILSLDDTSGDVDYIEALPVVGDSLCPRPVISFVNTTDAT